MVSYAINQATIQFSLRKPKTYWTRTAQILKCNWASETSAFCAEPLGPTPKETLNDWEGWQRKITEDVHCVYPTGTAGEFLVSQPAPMVWPHSASMQDLTLCLRTYSLFLPIYVFKRRSETEILGMVGQEKLSLTLLMYFKCIHLHEDRQQGSINRIHRKQHKRGS